jgi:polar amino acid transport system substrate-binding protein
VNHRAHVLIIGLLCLSALAAAGPPIVIAAEDAAGPWGGPDGRGCGNDLVAAAFAAADVELHLISLPYARAKKMVLAGEVAGCFGMSWSGELEGGVDFSKEPLYIVASTIFSREGSTDRVQRMHDLRAGRRLGIVIGYEYPNAIGEAGARGVELLRAPSETSLLKMLAEGRVDYAVLQLDPLKTADFVIARAGVKGRVLPLFALDPMGTYVGFSLKAPEGRAAKAAFDRGFELIKENGTFTRIMNKWKSGAP